MMFPAVRGLARSSSRVVTRPSLVGQASAPRCQAISLPAFAPVRTYVTTSKFTRDEVADKLNSFHSEVISANWADYLYLVYNVPFWEAELEKLQTAMQPYLGDAEMGAKYTEVQEMMDVMYQCEDVRDHLNELAELVTRASGFMGTGYAAEEKVENMEENAQVCAEAYDVLLKKHPAFKPKIEQSVGHGLAILRMKHKFKFSSMHRYFF